MKESESSTPCCRRSRILFLGGLLLVLYAIVGFLTLPAIIHPILEEEVSAQLDRDVSLERFRLNPFTLSATMEGFLITDHDGEALLSLKKGYANFQILSIFTQNWTLKELFMEEPYGRLVVNEDRTLNVTDILEKISEQMVSETEDTDVEEEPVKMTVGHLVVTDGAFAYKDDSLPLPFETVFQPISVDLRDFGTSIDKDAPYAFSATTESGEGFSWKGDIHLNPIRSSGEFSITNIRLPKYKPFHHGFIRLHVSDGLLSLKSSYVYDLEDDLRLSDPSISISELSMQTAQSEIDILDVESVLMEGASIDLKNQTANIASFTVNNGNIRIQRRMGGIFDIESIVPPAEELPASHVLMDMASKPTTESSSPGLSEWIVSLDSFQIKDSSLALIDSSIQNFSTVGFDGVQLQINNLSNLKEHAADFSFEAHSRHSGVVKTDGSFSLTPVAATVNILIDSLNLKAINNHLKEDAK
ncbi:MAG: DUF748 domain-containing protein, partial [Opitutaceae bacterium]|nr:DUF748 domain-containing protein [Opitutaceae bacterium]